MFFCEGFVGSFESFLSWLGWFIFMWTAAEDSALADAVRRLGLRWSLMAGEAQFASRSPFSLRQRWTRLCASLHTAAPACSSAALGASSISAPVVPPPSLELLSGFPPVPRILPLPPPPPRLGRGTSHGRSWTFSLTQRVHAPSAAALTFRRLTLVRNWRLDECAHPHRLLLCNLSTAEEAVRSYLAKQGVPKKELNAHVLRTSLDVEQRDSLGLVSYPGASCRTLTSSSSHLLYIGGPDACPCRLVSPSDVAGFMGIPARCSSFRLAPSAGLTPIQLCQSLAESVQPHQADYILGVAVSLCSACITSVGSMYSGLFDQLGESLVRVIGPVPTAFVAELCPLKLSVLRRSRNPASAYSNVLDALTHSGPVSVLLASPPCIFVSSAKRARNRLESTGPDCDLNQGAWDSTRSWVAVVTAFARTHFPFIIVVELTNHSHYPDCLAYINAELAKLPYFLSHGVCDAVVVSQVSFHRSRAFWIAIRWDVYIPAPLPCPPTA